MYGSIPYRHKYQGVSLVPERPKDISTISTARSSLQFTCSTREQNAQQIQRSDYSSITPDKSLGINTTFSVASQQW